MNRTFDNVSEGHNLSCYQCIKSSSEECEPERLLPCPTVADRCVTHISRNADKGFQIKRECGLGPCGFEDDMVNRGLGMDGCDRTKEDYFCVFCCKTDGCNRNSSFHFSGSVILVIFLTLLSMSSSKKQELARDEIID
ncbi:hypothetical protein RUM44_008610 [Polyplax serrata]|uniref:Protein sleepless n=1 Tax=Polyplax serrata TaxID=468196 RepID=A0ABR1BCS3_POLSC